MCAIKNILKTKIMNGKAKIHEITKYVMHSGLLYDL